MRRREYPRTHQIFGRDREIDEVRRLLEAGPGLITVTGRGGIGKTSVALEVVRTLGSIDGLDGGVWVPLAGTTDPDLVMTEIAHALGAPIEAGADAAGVVADLLGHGARVLALDNLEHLLGFVPALSELLDRCPSLRVLVTSRAALRLRSERVVALAPLPDPTELVGSSLEELAEQPAVATYCNQAAAVDWSFGLTHQNAPAIVELCRRLEGLPLAIELAAVRAAMLPAAEILRRLDGSDLDVLRRPRGDAPARHHGLRATIDWTYGLLAPDEQRALRCISVNVGTFDLDAAIALIDPRPGGGSDSTDALDALSSLVDFHLIDPLPGSDPPRFSIPDSIRVFALEELDRCGESSEVTSRRIALRARQARAVAEGNECCTSEGSVEADRDDLLDALRCAIDLGLADAALDLARGLATHWDLQGYGPVQEQVLERAIELGAHNGADPARLANATLWSAYLGLRHSSGARPDDLVARIREAERLAASVADDQAAFHAQNVWLLVTPTTGDLAQATAATEEGLRLAERNDDEGWRASIQVWAGMLAQLAGDEERAMQLGTAALDGARRRGDRETIVRAFMLLDALAERFPDQLDALPSIDEVIELARALRLNFYEVLLMLRRVHHALQRDPDASVERMAEALEKAGSLVASPLISFYFLSLVHLAVGRGHLERAASFSGALAQSPSVVSAYLPHAHVGLQVVLDEVRSRLGDDEFDRQVQVGASLTTSQAVDEAIRYVELLRQPSGAEAVEAEPAPTTEAAGHARAHEAPGADRLTSRQVDVLRLLSKGLSNKEIASELGVRPKTVMHHTTAIYRALGVRGRSEATAVAFRFGLVD